MNYIKQLEQERANLQDIIITRAERLQEFRVHLQSAKYTEPPSDGSRADWINTADVMRWLSYIETAN